MKQGLSMLSNLQATRQHHGNYICHHLNKYAYGVLLMTDTTMADIFPNTKLNSISSNWINLTRGKDLIKANSRSQQTQYPAICVDQAQEHVNKVHKGDAGIVGITANPESLLVLRYCLSMPERSLKYDDKSNCSRLNFFRGTAAYHQFVEERIVKGKTL